MNNRIIKTQLLLKKFSTSPFVLGGIIGLSIIILVYEWQTKNWLGNVLFVLFLALFIFYKKQSLSNEAHLQALLDNISDAIITIDSKGSVMTVNNGVEAMFGYRPSELLGNNIKRLMPEPYNSIHDSYLSNYMKTGEAHVIGQTRKVQALRRNGETFDVELWVYQLEDTTEKRFMGVIRDISERQHVDRIKTEFISTVSHELRTPLTSIRGSLGMLKSGILGEFPEKASRMVELAHNNTERLINLVNDILDAEKIQAGKMELKFAKLSLTALVKESIEANENYASNNQVTLKLEDNLNDFYVYADEQRLQQVMANLISNAAKYSLKQGLVSINIEKHNLLIRVSISDNGEGIPEKYRSKIFQKFSQADSSDTRQKGGTGLGLNITKAIVENHGGHIDYTSVEGQGSCFFFELTEYQGESVVITPENDEFIQALGDKLGIDKQTTNRGHILVLEDEKDIANLLALLLEQQNFKVTTCSNTQQAKQLINSENFDAVTVDIRLPGQDGLSFIKEIRAQETEVCLPMIIISAEAELNKSKTTSALRIVDWLDKPIDTEKLAKAMRDAISKPEQKEISTILYVEDNSDLIEMMSSLLGDKAKLVHAPNLQTAKHKIETENFDLMLLDVELPDGNGLELIALMNQYNPLTPVIIFSAQSLDKVIVEQVNAALVKSLVSNEELIEVIKSFINPIELEK